MKEGRENEQYQGLAFCFDQNNGKLENDWNIIGGCVNWKAQKKNTLSWGLILLLADTDLVNQPGSGDGSSSICSRGRAAQGNQE